MRRVLLLIVLTLALWVVLVIPARRAWGDEAVLDSGIAAALCLAPAALTLLWAERDRKRSPDQQLVMILGGTAVRLFAVLAGGYAAYLVVPGLRERETPGFWTWVGGFYLATLFLETMLAVAGRPAADRVTQG